MHFSALSSPQVANVSFSLFTFAINTLFTPSDASSQKINPQAELAADRRTHQWKVLDLYLTFNERFFAVFNLHPRCAERSSAPQTPNLGSPANKRVGDPRARRRATFQDRRNLTLE